MRNIKNLTLFVLIATLMSTAAVADIHYVNPGESIQAAIVAADPYDEIEVASGTYTEAIDFIGKAIRLYSSGGPDVTTIDGTGHKHVVQCVSGEGSGTILEGFTITGGNAATGTEYDRYGGGMLIYESSPTVNNCIFSGNTAYYGGGMCNLRSSPTVTDCTFSGNTADCWGGGMYSWESSPTVTNCTFTGNIAIEGGGMHNRVSSPTVTNCTFIGNTAYYRGGGMLNDNASPTVTDCTFTGNTADYGGGMANVKSSPTVTNCAFTGNTATEEGGGLNNMYSSSPTVTNCTFTVNTASQGGGMYNLWGLTPTLANCILWDDRPDEIFDDVGSSTTVTYSDVEGGWAGEGNIDSSPLFTDTDGRLSPYSPCIDAGNDAAVPPGVTTDLDGNPRIVGAAVDMGGYECMAETPMEVEIDIKPGSYPNAINLGSKGVIPVAILSSSDFDATTVNLDTIELAGAGVAVRGKGDKYLANEEDVNGDGLVDLVVQVETEDLDPDSFQYGFATITGTTYDGQEIEGSDEVIILPPRTGAVI